jgi:hypothetical protein
VFDLDESAAFTHYRALAQTNDVGRVTLLDEGGRELINPYQHRDFSGVLAPGRYTFVGTTDARSMAGSGIGVAGTSVLTDVRLSVIVPEPASLALLAGLLLCLPRRQPR